MHSPSTYKFIDLFAGLGGFHVGLKRLNLECVFASEIEDDLRNLYKRNHNIYPLGDIKEISSSQIPKHDIGCAGFPCVSYSVAGSKLGHKCPQWGNLIDHALDLMIAAKSRLIFLENVDNLIRMNNGQEIRRILSKLEGNGYQADYRVFSPHEFGIPQHRKRVYIVASQNGLRKFNWPTPAKDIFSIKKNYLNYKKKDNVRELELPKQAVLDMWQCLVKHFSPTEAGLSGTIFAAEYGSTYPYDINISMESIKNMRQYKGAFGSDLSDCRTRKQLLAKLPPYVANTTGVLPKWKQTGIKYSRMIFNKYSKKLPHNWGADMSKQHNSWQRLEWRGDRKIFDIWNNIIQFRPSGIRIFRRERFPCFVAVHNTQTPLIGWQKRYINSSEALVLQGINKLWYNASSESRMMRAVGNAVNAHVVYCIGRNLIEEISDD